MAADELLHVEELHAGYGPVEVLHGIELAVGEREIVVVLGANGAGKTTLLRSILGLTAAKGAIRFDDADISSLSSSCASLAGQLTEWAERIPSYELRRCERVSPILSDAQAGISDC